MSPYCSAHDEWLIMKLCMYVGYHDADNVSNFGGDPVTQLNLKKRLQNLIYHFVFQNMHSAGYHENTIGRTYFGGDQVTQLNLVLYVIPLIPLPHYVPYSCYRLQSITTDRDLLARRDFSPLTH